MRSVVVMAVYSNFGKKCTLVDVGIDAHVAFVAINRIALTDDLVSLCL